MVHRQAGKECLVTALYVAEDCKFQPPIRVNGEWISPKWQTLATSSSLDIAVFEMEVVGLDRSRIPVFYGQPSGLIYGQLGYVLGYPGLYDDKGVPRTDHIVEMEGRLMPLVGLVVLNFNAGNKIVYSYSYVNAGFSGGA